MRRVRAAIGLALGIATLTVAAPAPAAMPGMNGKIAFQSDRDGNIEVYAMNPNGSAQTRLTNNATYGDYYPAWSPDGQQIVIACFDATEFCLRSADGSGSGQFYGHGALITHPTWSPDGTRIAFAQEIFFCDPPDDPTECDLSSEIAAVDIDGTDFDFVTDNPISPSRGPNWSPRGDRIVYSTGGGLHTIRPDGTSATPLGIGGEDANWSPDGTRIAYSRDLGTTTGNHEIFVANADGTGETRLTTNTVNDSRPAWSPDGTKIAFTSTEGGDGEIFVMNADGTGRQALTNNSAADEEPDWQPLPYPRYPRPKGATPLVVALVPAFRSCASPDRTHGPPLAFGSCSSPAQSSSQLTVGTPDANSNAAQSTGFVRMNVAVGNPSTPVDEADVAIGVDLTDVRLATDLSDYAGALEARLGLRVTDRAGSEPVTVHDLGVQLDVACTATADSSIGAHCATTTSADALIPGSAPESARSIWALDQVRVLDGDGMTFATQGVFVP